MKNLSPGTPIRSHEKTPLRNTFGFISSQKEFIEEAYCSDCEVFLFEEENSFPKFLKKFGNIPSKNLKQELTMEFKVEGLNIYYLHSGFGFCYYGLIFDIYEEYDHTKCLYPAIKTTLEYIKENNMILFRHVDLLPNGKKSFFIMPYNSVSFKINGHVLTEFN